MPGWSSDLPGPRLLRLTVPRRAIVPSAPQGYRQQVFVLPRGHPRVWRGASPIAKLVLDKFPLSRHLPSGCRWEPTLSLKLGMHVLQPDIDIPAQTLFVMSPVGTVRRSCAV